MSESILIAIVGITVVLAEGLVGLGRLLITKFTEKDKKYLTDEEHQMLANLHDLHSRYDGDGTPIWYVPRSWAGTQKEIVGMLGDIAATQHKTMDLIDRLERRLWRLEGHFEKKED